MNHAKPLAGLVLAGLIAAGCSTGTKSASPEDYNQALADAKTAIAKAQKVNYVWRDTGKILKKAEEAAKAGDYDKATSLANQAKRQGELAYIQHEREKNAGPQ